MARLDLNRSGEMEVFVRVVALGGLSAAARSLRMTPSAVSKLVSRLEARLGARLINRSTRSLTLTPEGQDFHDKAVRVLADIDEAERSVATTATPRGRVRVNSSVPFGVHRLIPLVPVFTARYPEVALDLVLTDQVVNLMDERADVAIRVGPMPASQLMARKLVETRMTVVASPDYLARRGTPETLDDLAAHDLIGFNFSRSLDGWPFVTAEGQRITRPVTGRATAGDGETARGLALAGQGLARLSLFHIGPDLEAGRLVQVLEAFNPGDIEETRAVYVGHGGRLPSRVRVFLDFLAEEVRF
ncbi:LysR family transcriptional regulator [Brevundimonas lenta]|uniref:DNA-binding transcriptional LysR family regulator n=1 Tax=Brevundimonas lenta TaxID=424796 RepID=A0A7W6JAG6_9CAUL|nr:LysR family transcriptional regulator [Brevundimonas lenta]MBB4081504.1 DNA-binding transcriptional LysR family regulator [Brevundimonas lenta]